MGASTSRYFVYAAVALPTYEEGALVEHIQRAKRACFGTADVEIKSNWIRRPEERNRRYLEPCGMSAEALESL